MPNHIEKALHDPEGIYREPERVLEDDSLSKEEKIKILRQWEYDIRDLLVAGEENMPGNEEHSPSNEEDKLVRILKLLRDLGIETDVDRSPPTKHGGE